MPLDLAEADQKAEGTMPSKMRHRGLVEERSGKVGSVTSGDGFQVRFRTQFGG